MSSISSEGAMITMSGQAPGRGGWVGGGWVNKHAVKQVDSNKKIRKGGGRGEGGLCLCVKTYLGKTSQTTRGGWAHHSPPDPRDPKSCGRGAFE